MSVIHAPHKQEIEPRMFIFVGAVGLALVCLLVRLWYLQVVQGAEYGSRAERSRFSTVKTLAPRGIIFDRQGRLIAGVKLENVVTAIPNIVRKEPWVIDKIAALVGGDAKKMRAKVDDGFFRPYLPTPIFVGLPEDVATRIAEAADDLPGIDVDTQSMRNYPNSRDMSHILGYVWTPSQNDLDRINERLNNPDLEPAAYVGKTGIERFMETALMGKPGTERIEVDNRRHPLRVIGRENATPGNKVVLTLDRDLQKFANQTLADTCARYPGSGGSVIMIEPKTGEILCMASYPSFDSALFEGGISKDAYEALANDPMKPFVNRAIGNTYPPGSTFKILTTIAAARVNKLDYGAYVTCPGYLQIGNKKMKCENHPRGALNFLEAFSKSCNTYFGGLALKAGWDNIRQTALDAGFGGTYGVDIIGEAGGVVPTDKWIRAVDHLAPDAPVPFYRGYLVNMGIGQGDLSVTPLQMVQLAALVANDGVNYKPHFVKATIDEKGKTTPVEPTEAHRIDLPDDFWAHLKSAMVSVVTTGTAHHLNPIDGVSWGGKTGSAENKKGVKTHAWFVGVAPMDNPQVAVVTMIERSGHGGDVAAPIAARLIRYWLKDAKASSKADAATSASLSPPDAER